MKQQQQQQYNSALGLVLLYIFRLREYNHSGKRTETDKRRRTGSRFNCFVMRKRVETKWGNLNSATNKSSGVLKRQNDDSQKRCRRTITFLLVFLERLDILFSLTFSICIFIFYFGEPLLQKRKVKQPKKKKRVSCSGERSLSFIVFLRANQLHSSINSLPSRQKENNISSFRLPTTTTTTTSNNEFEMRSQCGMAMGIAGGEKKGKKKQSFVNLSDEQSQNRFHRLHCYILRFQ